MRIEALTPHFAEPYEEFLLARPETLLFQSWRYQSMLIDLLGCSQQGLLALMMLVIPGGAPPASRQRPLGSCPEFPALLRQ